MSHAPDKRPALDIPPVYFALAVVAMVALDRFLPIARLLDPAWFYAGVIAIIGGIALAVVAERLFARAETGVRPFTPSTAVVRTGPYRFTRNPMYLGMIIVLFGGFLLSGNLSPLLVIPVFFWRIHTHFVLHEEAHMERHLGQAYLDYKQSVRRWI